MQEMTAREAHTLKIVDAGGCWGLQADRYTHVQLPREHLETATEYLYDSL